MSASAGECCSVDGCATGQKEDAGDHHDKECSSICNPFQSCGCCAFSVVVPQQISFIPTVHTEMPRMQWGTFIAGIAEEPVSGFWQPPRA
ncbi:hypothetical protein GCM10023093_13520 [Nemorincola caseinilytica]|uniref:Uncharacterized protein n=2 Tax=Nemorincola caseinilytica TaxID=2054315 RepID=A0ABP8NAH7_9BACT